MGFYINPKDGSSKEDWLKANGTKLPLEAGKAWDTYNGDSCLVAWIDQGTHTAALIVWDQKEKECTLRSLPDEYWVVPKSELRQFIPERARAITGF